MDIHSYKDLLKTLDQFLRQPLTVTFTQWDSDYADEEEVIDFTAALKEFKLTDNEFGEKDLLLMFQAEEEEMEILMEVPAVEEDLGVWEENELRIFGTESELIVKK